MSDLRKAQTGITQHLQNQLRQKEILIAQLQQELQNAEASSSALMISMQALDEQVAALSQQTLHLQTELDKLSTTKAAIRKLFKTTLKKAKLYNLIYEKHSAFIPVYNFLFRDRWQPATIPISNSLQTDSSESIAISAEHSKYEVEPKQFELSEVEISSNIDTETLLVEAIVVARALGIEINAESDLVLLNYLFKLIFKTKYALCINPAQKILPLLQAIAKAGGCVTCLACSSREVEIYSSYNLDSTSETLGNWLAYPNSKNLKDYDLLCLNLTIALESLLLLKGRLSPQTHIVTFPAMINPTFDWAPDDKLPQGLDFYSAPSKSWIDPLEIESIADHHAWPWNHPVIKLSDNLLEQELPKISIITVTLNQGSFLEETIRSVLMQGYPNLEYIVLDGGSSDNTSDILDRYRHELTYCVSEPDQGQANALNKGFSRATGDILAWLNSDDYYLPGTLFRVAMAFESYQCDLVTGGCRLYHDYNPKLSTIHHDHMPIGHVVPLSLEKLLDIDNSWLKGDFFYQPEVFWTRDIWERSGAALKEDLFFSMDYELWLRMAQAGAKVIHIPDIFVNYRVHKAQKTYGDALPYVPELHKVSKQFVQYLQ